MNFFNGCVYCIVPICVVCPLRWQISPFWAFKLFPMRRLIGTSAHTLKSVALKAHKVWFNCGSTSNIPIELCHETHASQIVTQCTLYILNALATEKIAPLLRSKWAAK